MHLGPNIWSDLCFATLQEALPSVFDDVNSELDREALKLARDPLEDIITTRCEMDDELRKSAAIGYHNLLSVEIKNAVVQTTLPSPSQSVEDLNPTS